jgi:diacylglycerol kinase family enzyme
VTLEAPLSVALPVAAVAGAVALSRVYTGAHYPGDVVGGVLLGIAAGLITRTVWPTLPDSAHVMRIQPVTSWRSADSGLGRGKGVVVVINSRAGAVAKGRAAFRAPAPVAAGLLPRPFPTPITHFLAAELPDAEITEVKPDNDFPAVLRAAAAKAEVLAVMGGDGSVNAAAHAALKGGLPLLVIPGGTLNHFSRALGIETPAAAIAAYRKGRLARVDVGCIRATDSPEIIFLNASSLGAYTELVEQRRRMEDRIGKWPALAVAAVRVLKDAEPVAVSINGRPRHIWLMFIGNCAYRSRGAAPTWRERLDDGLLDIRLISTGRRVRRLRAFVAVVVGHLHLGREYRRWTATSLHLHAGPAPIRIAHDGELSSAQGTITITKWPRALTVFTCARAENPVHIMRPGSTPG